jgi:group I intron endonuclease
MDVIYKLTAPNGKVYIGRSFDFENRMEAHRYNAMERKQKNKLYNAVRKYGWDNFTKEVIAETESEKAPMLEEQFIKAYDSVKMGYNSTYNGHGGGDVFTDRPDALVEMKRKVSKAITGEGNGMYGKSHSEEAKQKQREKAKGRFSLDWYIDRNGSDEGTRLYEERRVWLKTRNLKKDSKGRFIKSNKL